jgi:hypothetical protein
MPKFFLYFLSCPPLKKQKLLEILNYIFGVDESSFKNIGVPYTLQIWRDEVDSLTYFWYISGYLCEGEAQYSSSALLLSQVLSNLSNSSILVFTCV